jgi:hypothetical protein
MTTVTSHIIKDKYFNVCTKVKVIDHVRFKYTCRTYEKEAFMVLSSYKALWQ